jgi:anti-sigma regulatory factor (Ser/Thr protein kinase)
VSADAARSFDARPDELVAIDDFIIAFGLANGVPDKIVFRARVCIAELAANALEHGRAQPGVDNFEVGIATDGPKALKVTFADTTPAFDPTGPEPELDDRDAERVGGRGLKLVHGLPTASRYGHDGHRNIVQLQFLDRD